MPKNILLTLDTARGSDRAVDRALQLAVQWKSKLSILHVPNAGDQDKSGPGSISELIYEEISREISENPNADQVEFNIEIHNGNPAEQILAESIRTKTDLVVMGGAHHGSLNRKFLGSTVDRVLRRAVGPILSVKSRSFKKYETVLVVTDFSAASQRALDTALTFFPEQSLTLLNVHDVIPTVLPAAELAKLNADLKQRLNNLVQASLVRKTGILHGTAPHVATMHEFGAPVDVIARYVAEHRPSLVVMGTHGRTGFRRALLGSVAEELLRILPCDVLAVTAADTPGKP